MDPLKNDVFSLGLIYLEFGTLQNIQKIYNWHNFSIVEQELDSLINQQINNYSENTLVTSVVKRMLTLNAKDRPSFREIQDRMPPYDKVSEHFLKQKNILLEKNNYQEYNKTTDNNV